MNYDELNAKVRALQRRAQGKSVVPDFVTKEGLRITVEAAEEEARTHAQARYLLEQQLRAVLAERDALRAERDQARDTADSIDWHALADQYARNLLRQQMHLMRLTQAAERVLHTVAINQDSDNGYEAMVALRDALNSRKPLEAQDDE